MRNVYIFIIAFFALNSIYAQHSEESAAEQKDEITFENIKSTLFESEEVLRFTLTTDFKSLVKDKGEDTEKFPAILSLQHEDGSVEDIDLKVEVRGNFRKKHCSFPPIRLDFPKNDILNTLFAGENKLKLVTPCRTNADIYEQYILKEYLTYKIYNLLSDYSFRVRLVRVNYMDTGEKYDPVERYGFLIEDEDNLAKRHGSRIIEAQNVHPNRTKSEVTNVLSIFEYMIGNTDWSIPNLHNVKLMMDTIPGKLPIAVPYDFDWCGIVNAPYAKPNPMFETSSVRQRVYRGFCVPNEEFQAAVNVFNSQKDNIYQLLQNFELLNEKEKEKCFKYMEDFFDILSDPSSIEREIIAYCRTNR